MLSLHHHLSCLATEFFNLLWNIIFVQLDYAAHARSFPVAEFHRQGLDSTGQVECRSCHQDGCRLW